MDVVVSCRPPQPVGPARNTHTHVGQRGTATAGVGLHHREKLERLNAWRRLRLMCDGATGGHGHLHALSSLPLTTWCQVGCGVR